MRLKTAFKITVANAVLLSPLQADVVATFRQGEQTDVRMDRMPALSVPAEQAPTPFLEPGAFEVEWTGSIELKERRRLYFSFEGEGEASLVVSGKEVISETGKLGELKSKRLRLNPGSHEISVKYKSRADGSASFRLYWEEAGMVRQTISPLFYDTELNEAAEIGELTRHGRMVFAQQNCAKCHSPEQGFPASPMPELVEIAPILAGIGERVSEEWLRNWIADPKALKPSTHMPQLLDPESPEGRQQAADLAAFLASSKTGAEPLTAPDASLAKAGGAHFHELGCVACHYPADEAAGNDGTRRVPLNNVASKFLPGQLVAYLKKPEAYHPFSGMPNFDLSDEEADSIAAFLRSTSEGKATDLAFDFPEGDGARGALVAEALQCGTCHPGSPGGVSKAVSLEGVFKLDWKEKGCVSENDERANVPNLNLSAREREALVQFSKTGSESLGRRVSSEFAERQVEAKRCTACHALDEVPSLLDSVHMTTAGLAAHIEGLNERVDQTRPQLTFIGEMLYTSYIESILEGATEPRPRPWLGTRMPAFKGYAQQLAEGLSRWHGVDPCKPTPVTTDPELVKTGKLLIGNEGFGCTTCHGIGAQEPTAAFEVGAINFAEVSSRLRKDYYERWMDHPAGVIPGNKMPQYADGNESQRGDILEGDAAKQYEAIWQWLQEAGE